jgi:hypothetical protein
VAAHCTQRRRLKRISLLLTASATSQAHATCDTFGMHVRVHASTRCIDIAESYRRVREEGVAATLLVRQLEAIPDGRK